MKYNGKHYFRLFRLQDSARVMSAARRKNPKTGSTKNTENKPRKLIIIIVVTIIMIMIINFLLCVLADLIPINLLMERGIIHDQRPLRVHLLT